MAIPNDYVERVYAGVLGKIIGVYLGRPVEGWSYERITQEFGEISYYVHERLQRPLILADDDISGTFTFLRALPDYGNRRDLSPAQIGQTWLNYLIDRRTILWWGGMGNSTEHTAYLRLKNGIEAPRSGSIAVNGKVVAEQIGAQIFIDGWAMVAPGDPELAVDLARRAASVSHDGEAIYGAQVIAAMESLAFVEPRLEKLIDTAVSLIPSESVIYRMITDIREWHSRESDWRKTREQIAIRYGYDTYGGNCHMVPNHGLIILALLYGEDDFQKSLRIVNTCGWDTDCNSGNVGCLLGIKNGLAGLESGPDWRGPVADRMYLSTADGSRGITDALTEAHHVVNVGRALAGEPSIAPKSGARFHFDLPGAVQGFRPEDSIDVRGTVSVENVAGHSREGQRSLAIRYRGVASGRPARVATPTFIPPEALSIPGYTVFASPTLYSGQTVHAQLSTDATNNGAITCGLYLRIYNRDDQLEIIRGPRISLAPNAEHSFSWQVPDTEGAPIAEIGVEITNDRRADGIAYLDYIAWGGAPNVAFRLPPGSGAMRRRAWVDGVDPCTPRGDEEYRLIQNEGTGLFSQGTREWTDYRVRATVTPHMVLSAGVAARVQGMRRYYALLLANDNQVKLVKALNGTTVLGTRSFPWSFGESYDLALEVDGPNLRAWADGSLVFDLVDDGPTLQSGAIALVCEEGRLAASDVVIGPIGS